LNIRALQLAAALAVVFASTSMADINNATYNFRARAGGSIVISGFTNGTYTAPAGSGFCVGPPNACSSGSGLSGGYSFADISPTCRRLPLLFSVVRPERAPVIFLPI
jgi:hypothetical protein